MSWCPSLIKKSKTKIIFNVTSSPGAGLEPSTLRRRGQSLTTVPPRMAKPKLVYFSKIEYFQTKLFSKTFKSLHRET